MDYDSQYIKDFKKQVKKTQKKVNTMVVKSKKLEEFQAGKCSGTCKVTIIAVDEPREFGSEGKILQKIMVEDDTAKQWVAVFEPDIKYKMHMKINIDGYSKKYNEEWQLAVGHKKFGGGITVLPDDFDIPKSNKPKKKVETEKKRERKAYINMTIAELYIVVSKLEAGAELGHVENIIMHKERQIVIKANTEAILGK